MGTQIFEKLHCQIQYYLHKKKKHLENVEWYI